MIFLVAFFVIGLYRGSKKTKKLELPIRIEKNATEMQSKADDEPQGLKEALLPLAALELEMEEQQTAVPLLQDS